jgi:hypothetical protein
MSEDKTIQVLVRTTPGQADAVDNWRRQQPDIPSRPEAMRRLVEVGLQSGGGETVAQAFAREWQLFCQPEDAEDADDPVMKEMAQHPLTGEALETWFIEKVRDEWELQYRQRVRKQPKGKGRS